MLVNWLPLSSVRTLVLELSVRSVPEGGMGGVGATHPLDVVLRHSPCPTITGAYWPRPLFQNILLNAPGGGVFAALAGSMKSKERTVSAMSFFI